MKYLILLITLTGCAGANEVALGYIETTTEKLQPIVDSADKVCNLSISIARVTNQSTVEIEQQCDELWNLLKTVRDLQESAVTVLGGEPCCNQ